MRKERRFGLQWNFSLKFGYHKEKCKDTAKKVACLKKKLTLLKLLGPRVIQLCANKNLLLL